MRELITVLIAITAFCIGLLAGWRLTWAYMERVWRKYPEAFKTIIDGVVDLRKRQSGGQ